MTAPLYRGCRFREMVEVGEELAEGETEDFMTPGMVAHAAAMVRDTRATVITQRKSLVLAPLPEEALSAFGAVVGCCHDNADRWVAANPGHVVVRGWLLSGQMLVWHSVVRRSDGTLLDVTPWHGRDDKAYLTFWPEEEIDADRKGLPPTWLPIIDQTGWAGD